MKLLMRNRARFLFLIENKASKLNIIQLLFQIILLSNNKVQSVLTRSRFAFLAPDRRS